MNSSAADAHERLMSNPEFWKMFLPLFFDEDKIREFARSQDFQKAHTGRER